MKKILLFLMAAVMLCACHHKKANTDVTPIASVVNVDQSINDDNADMTAKYEDYTWYESQVTLNNYLDGEYEGVAAVVNVFQVMNADGDPHVIRYIHTTTDTQVEDIPGFWIEDFALKDVEVSFEQALSFLNAVNLPKPHSRQMCLRNPMGPIPCNPQWVAGNVNSVLFVDAVNGKISENNPAFPLGQSKWPQ